MSWYKKVIKKLIRICKDCQQEFVPTSLNHFRCGNIKRKLGCSFLNSKKNKNKTRQKYRISALIYYGGNPPKCICCKEKEIQFLTIDHINGISNRKHRQEIGQGGSTLYRWLKKNNFPKGFQVLCYNCNCSKGHYGICPHKQNNL